MSVGVLPEDGEDLAFTIIGLPGPGRRHSSQCRPVTWITDWTMTSAGTTWARLSEKAAETGLRPFLLADMPGEPGRPWGTPGSASDEVIDTPLDTTAIDRLDAAAILAGYWWDDEVAFAEDEEFRTILAPFGPGFPGLAPAIADELDPELMRRALYQYTRGARIGLVPAQRPADVLARLGWQGAVNSRLTADITAVLRSWEAGSARGCSRWDSPTSGCLSAGRRAPWKRRCRSPRSTSHSARRPTVAFATLTRSPVPSWGTRSGISGGIDGAAVNPTCVIQRALFRHGEGIMR